MIYHHNEDTIFSPKNKLKIRKWVANAIESEGKINYKSLAQLVQTSLYIYILLGVLSLIILYSIGYFTAENLISKQPNIEESYLTFIML